MSGRPRPAHTRRAELSQHFLLPAAAARLVQATSITPTDLVIEIGPGRGALTRHLCKRAHHVVGIEIDTYLARQLDNGNTANLQVINADFLTCTLPDSDYIAIGNVPYARASDMLRKLVDAERAPRDIYVVLQREHAHRLCGLPYVRESLWSLRLKPRWHVEILDRLTRQEFSPPPAVESVFLHLGHRERSLIPARDLPLFQQLVSQTLEINAPLAKALRQHLSRSQIQRLAQDLRFDAADQPNALMFEQWLGIFRFLRRGR
ncbi:MAG: rRNA adenine N(6)-methyltransferase family protein [Pseudomonadales bacterium]|nr:rRNA adenine N(6)-methyltransferase family protein [Pseudomonadales bacterium]MCP5183523.1 rRNA adenine N(6)-methyltransferase family protein [Pseudomonadales bacterium]